MFFCKIKSVERGRFMASSLKKLVNSLAEGIYKIKSKDRTCFLEYKRVNENWIKYKFLSCNKNHSNKNDEKFIKRFKNTFKFFNSDINKFILLLRKGIYPYEYMDEWKRFDETSLPKKENFFSNLNIKDIKDSDYNY